MLDEGQPNLFSLVIIELAQLRIVNEVRSVLYWALKRHHIFVINEVKGRDET